MPRYQRTSGHFVAPHAMLKKFWFQAHWLVGITAGVVLAIVGLTGGILSFETEIQDWLNRDVRQVSPAGAPLRPAALLARISEQRPYDPVASLVLSGDPDVSARVTFAPKGGAGAAEQGRGGRGPRGESRYVNPYTGAVLEGEGIRGQAFFRATRTIHRYLTAGEIGNQQIGKQLVGASTLLCVVLALSGLYLRWPRHLGNWRSWLTFDPALKGRSFLWHLHAVIGTWVLVAFLLMSLTGLYWSYDWYRNGLYAISGVERPAPRGEAQGMEGRGREGRGEAGDGRNEAGEGRGEARQGRTGRAGEQRPREVERAAPSINLDSVWRSFERETKPFSFSAVTLNLARQPGRPVEIRYLDADPAHERANNTLELDAATGAVLRHERYDDKRAGEKFMSSIFPLHSGSFFGLPGLVVYMIASLTMPVFAITGWMMYLDRRRKKRAAKAAESAAGVGPAVSGASPGESLLLAFASQAGSARALAWQTAGSLQAAGVPVDVQPLERLNEERLRKAQRALFVVSTFGEGEPPDQARSFARRVMRDGVSLDQLQFGLLALGDRQYQTFCEFGRTLEGWLRRQGARPAFPLVEVDNGDAHALARWREGLGQFAGVPIDPWSEQPYEKWTLTERRVLNPGSAGAPTYHIELAPPARSRPEWRTGDVAEILSGAEGEEAPKREFSIASISEDGCVHLVVRQVRKDDGTLGVGSGWLTERARVGTSVRMRIRSNPSFHLPEDARPMIFIGNGTGIAGLRGHIRARLRAGHRRNWLVFGERSARHDFYYRDELTACHAEGMLDRLDLAFSRDQAEKVYVQHRLRQQAEVVRAWIAEGAAIYVCGSAHSMAPAVHAALTDILGDSMLAELVESGRYRRDVY